MEAGSRGALLNVTCTLTCAPDRSDGRACLLVMGDPWLLENSDVSAPDACAVSVLGAGHVTIRLCVLGGGKSRQIARFGVRVGGGGKGLLRGSAVVKCKVGVLCTDQARSGLLGSLIFSLLFAFFFLSRLQCG